MGGSKQNGSRLFSVIGSEAMGSNWNTGGFVWTLGTLTVMVTGTDCPKWLWSSPPWRYSKKDTQKPSEQSSKHPGVEDPALNSEKEGWTGRFPVVPSNVRHSGGLNFPFSLPEQNEGSVLKFLTLDYMHI